MRNIKGIKRPRQVTFRGVTYPSLNALSKWAMTNGYNVNFQTIRLALNIGRDLEDVFAGKPFERKRSNPPVVYNGIEYSSLCSLYRSLYKKRKKVYLSKVSFGLHVKKYGIEKAVYRLLHPRITKCSISKRLGGSNNLVLLRLKHGWSEYKATHTKCKCRRKKGSVQC